MQALIITAYRDKDMLLQNLQMLSPYFKCFVHIDANSELNDKSYIDQLNSLENVKAVSLYKINWGSYLHMMAIFELLKMARKDSNITRFHIVSGEDFPIKSYGEFGKYFDEENTNKNFIELTDIKDDTVMKLRFEKYHFLHIFDRKSKNIVIIILDKVIRQLQYHLPFKRKLFFRYKGLVWASITSEAVDVITDYLTEKMIKHLKYCEIAEEFFIQNALMDSQLQGTVVTNNLRYADWTGSKTGPIVLRDEDYEKLMKSECFFARKIRKSSDAKVDNLYKLLVDKWTTQ